MFAKKKNSNSSKNHDKLLYMNNALFHVYYMYMYNTKLNDLRIIICLRKYEVSVEKKSSL